MLNYGDLNDIEFESLCKDIMSKKTDMDFRRFAKGRDGGVDLKSINENEIIIVQVKHYNKTGVSGLINSLKNEVEKVRNLNPDQYYICCSKELTANNIAKIYNMFSDYMESEKNIITLIEIDDFLQDGKNIDILRKHYKLWISSTNVLQEIISGDIVIDGEMILTDIAMQVKFFVKTKIYNKALNYLENNKVLLLTGDPGVGKTTTSKMLILHYIAMGYSIRCTTDVTNLNQLKKSLSQDKDKKEIILLDDCFGQAYFKMKETQENEILSLIRHVHLSSNKLLILNSRVTIYQEAKERKQDLNKSLNNKEYNVQIIDMNQISLKEKAEIFYNHLYFNNIKNQFWDILIEDKNYRRIVSHMNYNPRIIEFATTPELLKGVNNERYVDYILEKLENPQDIWNDEYERRLSKEDRLLLSTIYSLTDTLVSYDYVQTVFNYRISNLPNIDITLDLFNNSIKRLHKAFIKIIDYKGNKKIAMINPSINDYLRARIVVGTPEYNDIVKNSIFPKQLERLYSQNEYKQTILKKIKDKSILNFVFESDIEKNAFIGLFVLTGKIFEHEYIEIVVDFVNNAFIEPSNIDIIEVQYEKSMKIMELIFVEEIYNFYFYNYFKNWDSLRNLICKFRDLDIIKIISICYSFFKKWHNEFDMLIRNSLENYGIVDAGEYIENVDGYMDVEAFINNNIVSADICNSYIDEAAAATNLEEHIADMLMDDVCDIIDELSNDFHKEEYYKIIQIEVNNAEDVIETYIKTMGEDDMNDDFIDDSYEDYYYVDCIFSE